MARNITFPLKLKGQEVRSIEELRENFDLKEIYDYIKKGTLQRWLTAWGYETEKQNVEEIKIEDAMAFGEKMCEVFGPEVVAKISQTWDEFIAWHQQKGQKLKEVAEEDVAEKNGENIEKCQAQERALDDCEEISKEEILRRYGEAICKRSKFYSKELITRQQWSGLNEFAKGIGGDNSLIAFCDATPVCNGKKGIVFAEKAIYQNVFFGYNFINIPCEWKYEDIVEIEKIGYDIHIKFVNNAKVVFNSAYVDADQFVLLVRKLVEKSDVREMNFKTLNEFSKIENRTNYIENDMAKILKQHGDSICGINATVLLREEMSAQQWIGIQKFADGLNPSNRLIALLDTTPTRDGTRGIVFAEKAIYQNVAREYNFLSVSREWIYREIAEVKQSITGTQIRFVNGREECFQTSCVKTSQFVFLIRRLMACIK